MEKPEKKFYSALEPDSKKLHIVVDTETLALTPNAAVVEIAGHVLGKEEWFYLLINPATYQAGAFVTNPETVAWHEKRDPTYQALLESSGEHPTAAASSFVTWLYAMEDKYQARTVIWTRGTDFDIPVLSNFLKFFGHKLPWHYRNVRDIRTLGAMFPEIKVVLGDHTALGDVRAAATYMNQLAFADPRVATMLGMYQPGA